MSSPPAARSWYRSGRMWAAAAVLLLLVIVAAAAAVLSFDAIRLLAVACGFSAELAWLLPIAIDAGAAAGVIVWLVRIFPDDARAFAARFAAVMLLVSVAANFVSHWFAADHIAPPWWVIGAVSTIAPATLWVIVHLSVLAFRPPAPEDAHEDARAGADVRTDEPAHARTVALVKDDADEPLAADATEGDGYSAALRRDAAEFGVPLEPAPPGEQRQERRARLHRVRSRVDRARKDRARKTNPGPDDESVGTLVSVGGPDPRRLT